MAAAHACDTGCPEGVIGALRTAFSAAVPVLLLAALAFSGAATGARAEQLPLWEAGVGVTVLSFPDYRGSNERRPWVLPFPYLVYRGEFLKADERRMRGLFFKTDRVELDVSVNATVPVKSSENEARRGMPDLDPTLGRSIAQPASHGPRSEDDRSCVCPCAPPSHRTFPMWISWAGCSSPA
jgi:hypothetical protein